MRLALVMLVIGADFVRSLHFRRSSAGKKENLPPTSTSVIGCQLSPFELEHNRSWVLCAREFSYCNNRNFRVPNNHFGIVAEELNSLYEIVRMQPAGL